MTGPVPELPRKYSMTAEMYLLLLLYNFKNFGLPILLHIFLNAKGNAKLQNAIVSAIFQNPRFCKILVDTHASVDAVGRRGGAGGHLLSHSGGHCCMGAAFESPKLRANAILLWSTQAMQRLPPMVTKSPAGRRHTPLSDPFLLESAAAQGVRGPRTRHLLLGVPKKASCCSKDAAEHCTTPPPWQGRCGQACSGRPNATGSAKTQRLAEWP